MKNRIINKVNRLKNRKANEAKAMLRQKYLEYYENLSLDEMAVFLEARNGKEIDGNIYYVIKELMESAKYAGFRLYVSAEDEETAAMISRKLERLSDGGGAMLEKIAIVESDEYYRIAASSKYIVCDATLKNFFMKKDGQIYLNVWHGTPFKVMGRRVAHEPHATGNAQKNFVIADYLLYPNEYMMNHMVEDYMISNISKARILLGGYPRNTAFFDECRRAEVRKEQNLDDRRVYVYMPTHRPELMGSELEKILRKMDALADKNEVIYAKIHPLAAESVDFGRYKNIRKFPAEYETYEFLNIADCLITDYSSVFYDFAVTGRKIVLYTYDEEEYLSTRGLYEPMSTLPFDQVKTVEEVFDSARKEKTYDDGEFLERFCCFENAEATKVLCERVFMNTGCSKLEEREMPADGRANILVHAGNLEPGKRTDDALEFLEEADKSGTKYYLTFDRGKIKENKDILLRLPEDIYYFGRAGKNYETGDKEKDYQLLIRRCFGDMEIGGEISL